MPKPIIDRIAAIKDKEDKLAARRTVLEAKAKLDERKRDTRRKIVVGGAVLVAMEKDQVLAERVRVALAQTVGREIDKAVVADLLPPSPARAAAPSPDVGAHGVHN